MKNLKRITRAFILGAISLITSCEGDLEPVIYDSIAPSNFFKTREDVNAAVTAIYSEFSWNYENRIYNGEIGTDEYRNNWGGADQENNFEWNGDGSYSSMYLQKVPAVTRAGTLLKVIEGIDFLADAEKNRFIGEVKTARAIHMFDLLNSYGPCPVILDDGNLLYPDNSYKPERPDLNTTEGQEFYATYVSQIETDLIDATQLLNSKAPNYGRFDKGSALTILLKLYMHQKEYEKAEQISNQIINLGTYNLENNYSNIWSIDNEMNKEIIWALPRTSNTLGQTFRSRTLYSPYDLTEEDKWNGDKVRFEFYDSFELNDLRKNKIIVQFKNSKGELVDMRADGTDFYGGFNLKYDLDPDAVMMSGIDIIYLRYADVILCRAEALNEMLGPNQESIDLINLIRNRAGLADIILADFSSTSELRDHILAERGWEFYMEGLRREDLIRHNQYIERARLRTSSAQDFHNLYPIPKIAYYENHNISQNPGYDF
jgi:hypothetical protein